MVDDNATEGTGAHKLNVQVKTFCLKVEFLHVCDQERSEEKLEGLSI